MWILISKKIWQQTGQVSEMSLPDAPIEDYIWYNTDTKKTRGIDYIDPPEGNVNQFHLNEWIKYNPEGIKEPETAPSSTEYDMKSQIPEEAQRDALSRLVKGELDTFGINKDFYKYAVQVLGYNPSEEEIESFKDKFSDEEAYPWYSPEDMVAYKNLFEDPDGKVIFREQYDENGNLVTDANGDPMFAPFDGHWEGFSVHSIIDASASFDDIVRFQQYLEDNKIVPANYFAESRGVYSEKLRESIRFMMNWLDKNRHVVPGTDVYQEEIEGKNPIFFSSVSATYEEADYHRNLLEYAMREMAKEEAILDDVELARIRQESALDYAPPTEESIQDYVEEYFAQKLGRKPTRIELDKWSTAFAQSYSTAHIQNTAKILELQNTNFMLQNPDYLAAESSKQALMDKYDKPVDLSEFSQLGKTETFDREFEEEYDKQISDVERGRAIRKMQGALIQKMTGDI
jgi:hypothetical protein